MARKSGFPNIPFYATEAYKAAIMDVVSAAIERRELPALDVRVTYAYKEDKPNELEVHVNIWEATGLSHVLDHERESHLTEEAEQIKAKLMELVAPVIGGFCKLKDEHKRPMPRRFAFVVKIGYCTNALAKGLRHG